MQIKMKGNTKRHVNKLRGSSQSGLVPVKDRNRATISDEDYKFEF